MRICVTAAMFYYLISYIAEHLISAMDTVVLYLVMGSADAEMKIPASAKNA